MKSADNPMNKKSDKPSLLLLSDLWGREKSEWIPYYTMRLEKYFDIKYYDSCELGNIDPTGCSKEKIHQQFVNGGIEKAVKSIVQKETEATNILGFSIGGYIAWKACFSGLRAKNIFAISSTRLRRETEKPPGMIELFFGENDAFKPTSCWFEKMGIRENLYENQEHEFYRTEEIAEIICRLVEKRILFSNRD